MPIQPALLLLAAAAAWSQTPQPLQVVAVSPRGRTESATASFAIVATFNQPMVPLGAAAETGSVCPLRLEPAVKGRCRWQGTQTVSFEPEVSLPAATAFRARVQTGTRSLVTGAGLAEEFSWEFETPRPALMQSRPNHGERWIAKDARILLHFSLPMEPRRARDAIVLEESGLDGAGERRELAAGVRRATPEEIKSAWPWHWGPVAPSTANVLAVKPSTTIGPDKSYRLVMKEGLLAAEGSLGLVSERAIQFESWYTFRFAREPSPNCLPEEYRVAFTNPVRYSDFLKNLSVEPSTPIPQADGYRAGWTGSQDGHARIVWQSLPDLDYQPDSEYRFTVSGMLQDVFGNPLGTDARFTLRTGGYCPRLAMPQGFGVLEGYLPRRHPVSAVNVAQVPLQKARIDEEGFISFYNSIDWSCQAPMALPSPVVKTWDLTMKRNARLRTYIDLSEALGGWGGLVFTQVHSPNPGWHGACWLKAVDDVTRLGLTLKDSPESTLIWTSYLKTGAPVPRAPVEIRDDANRLLWSGRTDMKGFADAPGWKGLGIGGWKRWQRPKLWILARDPAGTAVLSTEFKGELSPWRFNLSYDWTPRPFHYRGALFTERGVYRPGETVRLKGILRKLEKGDWTPLDGAEDPRTLRLVVTDPRGTPVLRSTVTLSSESSFHSSLPLREEAPTGVWAVTVTEAREESTDVVHGVQEDEEGEYRQYIGRERRVHLSETFRVEAFKPASFEVHVTPGREYWVAGDTYTATVDGWYLFGAPMSEAPVDWTLRLEPSYFAPPGYEGFDFAPGWWERTAETGRLAGSGSARLEGRGKARIEALLHLGNSRRPMAAAFEAGVASPDRQRLFGRSVTTVHPAELYLGLRPSKTFLEAGKPLTTQVVSVRPDGARVEGAAVEGRLVRRDWLSAQRAGVAGRLEWVSEQRDTTVSTFSFVSTKDTFTWTTVPAAPGQYFLTVGAKDEAGRQAEAAVSFYATGKGEAWWARADSDIIELAPDKKVYRPGETARILVKSPYARSRAMVTVEREGVLARWLTELDGGADFIRVPLTDDAVPNVYVGVMLVQGRAGERYDEDGEDLAKPQAKFGYASLSVDPGGRRIRLNVSTEKAGYRPGDEVTVSLKTTDESGRGTPSEVTVYAVDEGVLALTGYRTPDVFSEFYGPRPLQVGTADSRHFVIGQRSFGEKGKNRGGAGGEGVNLEGVDLRSRFIPTAFWEPAVRTGPTGEAKVSFRLPDNLSKFRVMAVAHAGKRFGSGESKLTVSKPLLMRPSLPRLARIGDSFKAGVVLHNYSTQTVRSAVRLDLDAAAVSAGGEGVQEVALGPGKAVEVLWACKAERAGVAVFNFRAAAGKETDGLRWQVPVTVPERLEFSATSGVAEAESVEEVQRPKNARPDLGKLQVSLSPTALAGLQEGARFLLEYPYGCLEQRLSRMLPVIVGADLVSTFGLGSLGALKAEVQKELAKLPDFQHPSGGFGYWPNPWLPDPYATIYVLEVAHLAAKEGYVVPRETVEKAVQWLERWMSEQRDWAYPYSEEERYVCRGYAVYVLALHGRPMPGPFETLFQKRDQIPYLAKAYLLKAAPLTTAASLPAETLASEMLNQSRVSPRSLHFEEPAELRMPWVHPSSVKTTAVALQALLQARGGFPGDEKAVSWLVEERKGKGRWRTTQENSHALWALQDFYRRYEGEEPAFEAQVSLQGAREEPTLWRERFAGRTLLARTRGFPNADLLGEAGRARLKLAKSGTGRLYYSLALSFSPTGQEKASEGLDVSKEVRPLLEGELKAGRRAVVTLTVVTPQDRTFVVLDDALPAGWEIVDPTFAVEGREEARVLAQQGARGPYWGTFHRAEKYDDKILVFADFLAAGEHQYSYLIQATTPGRFHQPATWVEQMYQPEVFGRTASSTVEVGP